MFAQRAARAGRALTALLLLEAPAAAYTARAREARAAGDHARAADQLWSAWCSRLCAGGEARPAQGGEPARAAPPWTTAAPPRSGHTTSFGPLPERAPSRLRAGPGTGAACALSSTSITQAETGLELEFFSDDDGGRLSTCFVHQRCFSARELGRQGPPGGALPAGVPASPDGPGGPRGGRQGREPHRVAADRREAA